MSHLPLFRTCRLRREQGTCTPVPGLDLPFTVLEGAAPGPILLVTAGVHGAEFCSIEAALRLTRLDPAALRGTRVVLPILNPGAFRAHSLSGAAGRQDPGTACSPAAPTARRASGSPWAGHGRHPLSDATLDLHGGDLVES